MTRPLLYCPACDGFHDPADGLFACPEAGGGREHVLDPRVEASPELARRVEADFVAHPDDPLSAFAGLGVIGSLAGPRHYAALAARLQEGLSRFEGSALRVTPLTRAPRLAGALGHRGEIAVKDETGQPGGSHKVRHLAGTMLYLEALRGSGPRRPLAISSCGNAALAAACVARASGYELTAFVPEDVHPGVAALLAERGATVSVTPRLATGAGDPCYRAFRKAVEDGAVPFCCSGRDNWSNIEGGRSLGYEAALQWEALGGLPGHLVLQIGGGALARSVAGAFEFLEDIGAAGRSPRIHAVQTEGAFPFARAWLALLSEAARPGGITLPEPAALAQVREILDGRSQEIERAVEFCRERFSSPAVRQALALAAREPHRFMRPWDGPAPHSLAHGILDDETYDWFFLARAMLRTGGRCVVAGERQVARALDMAREFTDIDVSATGSAGLAGLLELKRVGAVDGSDTVGLFFTGINR